MFKIGDNTRHLPLKNYSPRRNYLTDKKTWIRTDSGLSRKKGPWQRMKLFIWPYETWTKVKCALNNSKTLCQQALSLSCIASWTLNLRLKLHFQGDKKFSKLFFVFSRLKLLRQKLKVQGQQPQMGNSVKLEPRCLILIGWTESQTFVTTFI